MVSLDYKNYSAKPLCEGSSSQVIARRKFSARSFVCDTLLLPYALLQHRRLLRSAERVDSHTYTGFLRAPSQLELLSGPVLDFLRPERLKITLLACSNGAEAYTISSWLRQKAPDLDFHIQASDLHPEMVKRAEGGEYTRDEALHCPYMTNSFMHHTFEQHGDTYVVRPEVRRHVSFSVADIMDGAGLKSRFGQAPLVIAQNVLFHLRSKDATRAFANLVDLMEPRGVLLVEGMDLDLREALTAQHGLEPFTDNLREIYEETRIHTPARWWRYYWGTEPFIASRRNPERRYATAFKRDAGA